MVKRVIFVWILGVALLWISHPINPWFNTIEKPLFAAFILSSGFIFFHLISIAIGRFVTWVMRILVSLVKLLISRN